MDKLELMDKLALGVSIFIGAISFLLGGIDNMIRIFIVLLCLDYLSGILKAGYIKKVDSKIGSKGVLRKLAKFLIIAIAFLIQNTFNINAPIRNVMVMFLIANESLSILENLAVMDIPVINKLKPILNQASKNIEKQFDKITKVFVDDSEPQVTANVPPESEESNAKADTTDK